jgi:hypothetical protein
VTAGPVESAPARAPAPVAGAPRALARAAVLLVLAAALALAHGEIWLSGATRVVPLTLDGFDVGLRPVAVEDVTFESWLVARQARVLGSRPWRLFETEHCAPEPHSLVFGIPMIALGVLAMPAAPWTQSPIAVYNAALVMWSGLAALAMYLLVASWTGQRAAGLVAALLFAFHPMRLGNITHPAEWDSTWTVFLLYFAERLFAHGRWRDAAGLGASGAMLVATSFYSLLAATLLAVPLGAWLLLRRAPRRVTAAQLACVAACVALATAVLMGPYLGARESARIHARDAFFFAGWPMYLPGGPFFLGGALLAAALFGVMTPKHVALSRVAGDPRPALLAGAALVAFVAAGPATAALLTQLGLPVPGFDPYAGLAEWIPGLDSVRAIARLSAAVHMVACVLAGAGVASAIAYAGRRALGAAIALVALAFAVCFHGPPLGVGPLRWTLEPIAPSPASIEFFEALAAQGNRGALLELPLDFSASETWFFYGPSRILLSGWHGRRTSACFGSFVPPGRKALESLVAYLPTRESIRALREQGFTTIVIHHPNGVLNAPPLLATLDSAANEPDPPLRMLQRIGEMSAYALLDEPAR